MCAALRGLRLASWPRRAPGSGSRAPLLRPELPPPPHLDGPVLVHQQVGGLEVSVDDGRLAGVQVVLRGGAARGGGGVCAACVPQASKGVPHTRTLRAMLRTRVAGRGAGRSRKRSRRSRQGAAGRVQQAQQGAPCRAPRPAPSAAAAARPAQSRGCGAAACRASRGGQTGSRCTGWAGWCRRPSAEQARRHSGSRVASWKEVGSWGAGEGREGGRRRQRAPPLVREAVSGRAGGRVAGGWRESRRPGVGGWVGC